MQLRIVGRIQKEELSLHRSPGAELSVLPDCSARYLHPSLPQAPILTPFLADIFRHQLG